MKRRVIRIFATLIVGVWLIVGSAVPVLADTYNCGSYGAGTYQADTCSETGLENTGQPLWPIIIAVTLILIGTFWLYRTRKKMKTRVGS